MWKEPTLAILVATLPAILVVTIFGASGCLESSYERGYVQACKDFYQGKPKYDLVKHPDGTATWEKTKPAENK